MVVRDKALFYKAQQGGYAIPAINTQGGNFDIIWAICRAAEELKSPIMLAHYVSTGAYSGNDWFVEVSKWCANKVSVPVFIHLDHGEDYDICKESIDLGFTSVMIDGSALSVTENAELTNRVIGLAGSLGIPVEAEIGELLRLDDCGVPRENKNLADPEDVRRFLELCRPDTLAVGIGNAHGYYNGTPDIHLEILDQVRALTDIPLVMHGCTGLSDDVIRETIKRGVAKINFGTEIRYKYVEHYQEGLETFDHKGHSWMLSQYANDKLTEDVKRVIELSGSAGKA